MAPPSSDKADGLCSVKAPKGSVCAICREPAGKITALSCGHAYCDECWGRYIELKVADGDTRIGCPEHKCPLRVPEETVSRLCSAQTAARYTFLLRKSFVDESRHAAWCPKPGCSLAVDTSGGEQFVTCAAGHAFCVACKLPEAHAPVDCETVRTWLRKCDDDSETANWLSVNTQDCPQCHSTIEKNGGWYVRLRGKRVTCVTLAALTLAALHSQPLSNHMTCKQCKHEYCWVCLGPWAKHDNFYRRVCLCAACAASTRLTRLVLPYAPRQLQQVRPRCGKGQGGQQGGHARGAGPIPVPLPPVRCLMDG